MKKQKNRYKHKVFSLPGFPWDGKFQDMTAVRKYFSHDRLQCLLCGRDYIGLGNHIVEGHGISIEDYKGRFGLPWSFGLNGKALKEAQGRRIRKTRHEGRMPYAPSPAHVRTLQEHKKRKNRKTIAAVRNEAGKRALKMFGLERKWDAGDYEEFLRRVKTGRTSPEVAKDKDMPAAYLFQKYMRNNPEFRKKFEAVWDNLPFEVQSRGLYFGGKIKARVIALRMKGNTWPDVGRLLNIPEHSARMIWFNVKHKGADAERKKLEDYEKSLRLDPKLFEEFLRRIASGRTPSEVGRDKDMPSRLAFDAHVRKNPAFRKRYDVIWCKLPFAVQVRGQRPSPAFAKAVIGLRVSGLSWKDIAHNLGVGVPTVQGLWTRLKKTGAKAEKKIIAGYSKKLHKERFWAEEKMDEFLRRIKSGRTPAEVAGDDDMPLRGFFDKYVRKHPDYKRRYRKIWESLPFSVQLRGNRLGDRFKKEVARLKGKGLTDKEIGKRLGVRHGAVSSVWSRMKN